MFSGGKNKQETAVGSNLLNIIGSGTAVTGDLISEGDIRVDGSIEGHVTVKQRLVLGEGGAIKGDIHALDATISGQLTGNITVSQMLVLKPTAKIDGDITTDKIIIESGAQFNGKCTMNQMVPNTASTQKVHAEPKAKSTA